MKRKRETGDPENANARARAGPSTSGLQNSLRCSELRWLPQILVWFLGCLWIRGFGLLGDTAAYTRKGPAQVIKHEIGGPAFSLSLTPIHSLRRRLVRSRQYAYQDVAGFLRF